ncbi:hypothetical protein B484DRAFT_416308 [Ochromonadaceae sp. CCMP2298]|nr:hypothetical protein B484DRAFT_416308 [Ochromonadaceae sp. CCMP2298]
MSQAHSGRPASVPVPVPVPVPAHAPVPCALPKALKYWINSVPTRACVLAESVGDLRDGQCFCDIVQHIFGLGEGEGMFGVGGKAEESGVRTAAGRIRGAICTIADRVGWAALPAEFRDTGVAGRLAAGETLLLCGLGLYLLELAKEGWGGRGEGTEGTGGAEEVRVSEGRGGRSSVGVSTGVGRGRTRRNGSGDRDGSRSADRDGDKNRGRDGVGDGGTVSGRSQRIAQSSHSGPLARAERGGGSGGGAKGGARDRGARGGGGAGGWSRVPRRI